MTRLSVQGTRTLTERCGRVGDWRGSAWSSVGPAQAIRVASLSTPARCTQMADGATPSPAPAQRTVRKVCPYTAQPHPFTGGHSVYRDRLLNKGTLVVDDNGLLRFTVPGMAAYVLRRAGAEQPFVGELVPHYPERWMVDEGGRAVDALDGGDSDDGCRRAAIGPPPAARPVVQHDHVTGEVNLHPGDTGPPVGNKPAPISCEPSSQPLGGYDGVAPSPVPPCGGTTRTRP